MKMIQIPNRNYSIGETSVTQSEWKGVMGTEPWKGQRYVQEGDDYPAVYISWEDAVEFCEKLSAMEGKTYRLPTEAEWGYACRGGTNTDYHFGDDPTELGKYAWFGQNTWRAGEQSAQRVAKKIHNQFGLYDMHGNVWEWCSDLHGSSRVLRGGSWFTDHDYCHALYRIYYAPANRSCDFGFRLASTSTELPELPEKWYDKVLGWFGIVRDRKVISVNVDPSDRLHWTALIGSESPRCTRFIDRILRYIARVFQRS